MATGPPFCGEPQQSVTLPLPPSSLPPKPQLSGSHLASTNPPTGPVPLLSSPTQGTQAPSSEEEVWDTAKSNKCP